MRAFAQVLRIFPQLNIFRARIIYTVQASSVAKTPLGARDNKTSLNLSRDILGLPIAGTHEIMAFPKRTVHLT